MLTADKSVFQKIVRTTPLFVTLIFVPFVGSINAEQKSDPLWELRQDDRVVFLGSTFIERENNFGMIEMSLRVAFPDIRFSTRNLGWSGDNVLGESRAYFGSVEQGYAHLQEYVKLTDPTVLIVSYGHNAAFEGEAKLDHFLKNYEKLLDDLTTKNRRLIVLGPTPMEAGVLSTDETARLNQLRRVYGKGIRKLCQSKQIVYIDMLDSMLKLQKRLRLQELTTNGVHLNQSGYALAGEVILNSMGKSLVENDVLLLFDSQFQAISKQLREGVLRKNELFFHRFRPENETYLRGFRKHEQGQNAKEIYDFDVLVDEQEKKLIDLTQSVNQAWRK